MFYCNLLPPSPQLQWNADSNVLWQGAGMSLEFLINNIKQAAHTAVETVWQDSSTTFNSQRTIGLSAFL